MQKIEQNGMTFDHDFCYSFSFFFFPFFGGREEKRGKEQRKSWSKVMPFCSIHAKVIHFLYIIFFRMAFISLVTCALVGYSQKCLKILKIKKLAFKPCFWNKKYPATNQTRTTQIVNNIFLFKTSYFRIFKGYL